jgi:DnaJ-domain-containing protein 1
VTATEVMVMVVCLVIGYIVVHLFLNKDETPIEWSRDSESKAEPGAGSDRPYEPPPGERPRPETYEPFGPRWATVLGVRPEATREEISAAYKRKISEYHPDKVTRLGPEIRELAEQRSKEINTAYEEALRRFR